MGLEETTLPSEGDAEGGTKRSSTGDSDAVTEDTAAEPVSEPEGVEPDLTTDDASAPGDSGAEEADADELEWLTDPWYRTQAGVTMLLIDVGLIVVLAATTMTTVVSEFLTVLPPQTPGHIPWFVYAFSALGGLGYVFTALLEDFQSETKSLLKYNLRVPAALPLGAGVWILSGVLIGPDASPPLVLGLAFLSGLYVNLAYERFGALARRLLPDSTTDESEPEPEADSDDESSGGPDVPLNEQTDADDQPGKPTSPSRAHTD